MLADSFSNASHWDVRCFGSDVHPPRMIRYNRKTVRRKLVSWLRGKTGNRRDQVTHVCTRKGNDDDGWHHPGQEAVTVCFACEEIKRQSSSTTFTESAIKNPILLLLLPVNNNNKKVKRRSIAVARQEGSAVLSFPVFPVIVIC